MPVTAITAVCVMAETKCRNRALVADSKITGVVIHSHHTKQIGVFPLFYRTGSMEGPPCAQPGRHWSHGSHGPGTRISEADWQSQRQRKYS